MSYDETDRILFSADAFGKFGALSLTEHEGWACEARRYYFNICGKYGRQVQALLNKIKDLPMEYICPLHGPVIQENLQAFVRLYHIWSSYQPENEGVLIAYASIHGGTKKAAEKMADGQSTKIIVPSNLQDLASLATVISCVSIKL